MSLATAPLTALRRPPVVRGYPLLLTALAVFCGVHVALRLLVTPSLEPDDADRVLFSQSLAGGYSEQPPLYDWLVWAGFKLFGMSILTLTVLRLVVLAAVHVLLYALAREVRRDERAALLSAAAPLLMPAYFWNAVAYLSHTLLLCAATLATALAVLRLRRGRTRDYLGLGLLLGVGALSKYNYAVFAAAMFLAGLRTPPLRSRLLDRRMLLAGLVALAVVLPHLVWLGGHGQLVRDLLALKTGVAHERSPATVGRGVLNLAQIGVVTLTPLWVVCLALFPRGFLPRAAGRDAAGARRFLGWSVVFTLALVLLPVLGGTSRFQDRWLQPIFLLAPVPFFARLDRASLTPARLKLLTAALLAGALGVTAVRAAQIWVGGRDRGRYPLQMDFGPASGRLTAEGFGGATVFTTDREIAGNLRLRLPGARVVCAGHPAYAPPPLAGGPRFFVWNASAIDLDAATLDADLRGKFGLRCEPGTAVGSVEVPAVLPGRAANRLGYVRLAPGPEYLPESFRLLGH
jgi:hypothetical protein